MEQTLVKRLSHLFEPFFTSKEMGKGTGLGLITVYSIVKQNSGFITDDSQPGQGTAFWIFFPPHAQETENAQENMQPLTTALGHETILLTEDGAMMLDITSTILSILGYKVLSTSTPSEAHQLTRKYAHKIHLLITDVIMPAMNRREPASSLQGLYPDLKCLFMSGYTANVIAHHGVLDAGVHFLAKPFTMKNLAAKIREILAAAF